MGRLGLVLALMVTPVIVTATITPPTNSWFLDLNVPQQAKTPRNGKKPTKQYGHNAVPAYLVKRPAVDITKLLETIQNGSRRIVDLAAVEMGPGSIKPLITKYRPNYLKDRLKRLIFLKQKTINENKDLNAK